MDHRKIAKAGVIEKGKYLDTERGTPQGAVLSPALANIYLHYVLDLWFEKEVKRNLKGRAILCDLLVISLLFPSMSMMPESSSRH